MQSVSIAHAEAQTAPLHWYGEHEDTAPAAHAPALQSCGPVTVATVHEPAAHSASGSVLAETLEHVPFAVPVLAAEQALQVPVQLLLQQKPSMQLPLLHWLPVPVQARPCAFFAVHVEPAQYAVLMQSLSPAHVVRQAAPLHW
jgi:hypothetical protein